MPTFVRVRDKDTGHEYDLSPQDSRVRDGVVEVLEDYPQNTGASARPRPAKHRTDKTGRPITRKAAPSADVKEQQHGSA